MSEDHKNKVIQVLNPDALVLEEVRDLFERAFADDRFPDAQDVLVWCSGMILKDSIGLFVVRDLEGEWNGLAIIYHEGSVWWPDPIVLALYSNGSGVFRSLLEALSAWMRERELDRTITLNLSQLNDQEIIERVSSHASGEVMGSTIRYILHDKKGDK